MSRFAEHRRVFFIEPATTDKQRPRLSSHAAPEGVTILSPHLARGGLDSEQRLVQGFIDRHEITRYVLWYDTPLAVSFTHRLTPTRVVYDRTAAPAAVSADDLQVADSALLLLADLIIGPSHRVPDVARGILLTAPAALSGEDVDASIWDEWHRQIAATLDTLESASAPHPPQPPRHPTLGA